MDWKRFEQLFFTNAHYGLGHTGTLAYITKEAKPAAETIRLFLTSWHDGFGMSPSLPCPPRPSPKDVINALKSNDSLNISWPLPLPAIVTENRVLLSWLSAMRTLQEQVSVIFSGDVMWINEPQKFHGHYGQDWEMAYRILKAAEEHDIISRKEATEEYDIPSRED